MFRPVNAPTAARVFRIGAAWAVVCLAPPVDAWQRVERPTPDPEQVVITSGRASTDQEVTRRVTQALETDRYLDASHITVTTRDGVVHLDGVVGSLWDLRKTLRAASRTPGVVRVEEDLYMPDFDNGP